MDTSSTANSFPIAPIIAGAFGLFTGLYLEKFKNRTIALTQSITFQSLGSEIKHQFWGEIAVTHNGRNIKHLSFITVTLKNDTGADVQGPLILETWVDSSSQFLGYDGHYDTGNSILMEENFYNQYAKVSQDLEEDIRLRNENENHKSPDELAIRLNVVQSNRKLILPAFNRKSYVTINFLVENFAGVVPKISLSILQKGIKIVPEDDKAKTELIKKIAISCISILLYITGLIWLFSHYGGEENAIISTIIAGVSSSVLGYCFYYIFIYLKKIFW